MGLGVGKVPQTLREGKVAQQAGAGCPRDALPGQRLGQPHPSTPTTGPPARAGQSRPLLCCPNPASVTAVLYFSAQWLWAGPSLRWDCPLASTQEQCGQVQPLGTEPRCPGAGWVPAVISVCSPVSGQLDVDASTPHGRANLEPGPSPPPAVTDRQRAPGKGSPTDLLPEGPRNHALPTPAVPTVSSQHPESHLSGQTLGSPASPSRLPGPPVAPPSRPSMA